jgi:hypothetical protein
MIEATIRETPGGGNEPLHEFPGGSSGELAVQVYADHLEVHAPGRIVAVWYRNLRGCLFSRTDGRDALAIVDRIGQVLLIPMRSSAIRDASWLIEGLRRWASAPQPVPGYSSAPLGRPLAAAQPAAPVSGSLHRVGHRGGARAPASPRRHAGRRSDVRQAPTRRP